MNKQNVPYSISIHIDTFIFELQHKQYTCFVLAVLNGPSRRFNRTQHTLVNLSHMSAQMSALIERRHALAALVRPIARMYELMALPRARRLERLAAIRALDRQRNLVNQPHVFVQITDLFERRSAHRTHVGPRIRICQQLMALQSVGVLERFLAMRALKGPFIPMHLAHMPVHVGVLTERRSALLAHVCLFAFQCACVGFFGLFARLVFVCRWRSLRPQFTADRRRRLMSHEYRLQLGAAQPELEETDECSVAGGAQRLWQTVATAGALQAGAGGVTASEAVLRRFSIIGSKECNAGIGAVGFAARTTLHMRAVARCPQLRRTLLPFGHQLGAAQPELVESDEFGVAGGAQRLRQAAAVVGGVALECGARGVDARQAAAGGEEGNFGVDGQQFGAGTTRRQFEVRVDRHFVRGIRHQHVEQVARR